METTKLHTVEDVTDAIVEMYRKGANEMRGAKPAELRLHNALTADLHEMRAQLWRELRDQHLSEMASAAGLDTVAFAFSRAAELDDRQAQFFRTQAGQR